jgi:FSR family fosmidomycin resistance protein-like MFS transporter
MKKSYRSLPNPLANLGFMHILNDGFLASFPLLLPFIQKDLGLGFGSIGFLGSVLGSAGVVLALPSSVIARRFGGNRVLGFALMLYSVAFILTAMSSGFVFLTISFALASIGFGLFHPISFALVAHRSNKTDVGKKMGNFTAIGDFGRIGIAALATFVVAALSWRETAFIYGIVPLALFCYSLFFCRPLAGKSDSSKGEANVKPRGLRYSRDFALTLVTGSIDALASSSLFVFIPFLLIHRGVSPALLGSLSGAFFVGNMLGKVLIGKVIDRLGCFKVFVFSEIIMAILLVLLSIETSTPLIAVFSILLGAVTKGTVPVINTMVTHSVPDRELYEKAFGIVSFAGGIAGVVAPLLLGLVASRFGIVSVFHLSAGFAVLAILPCTLDRMIRKFSSDKGAE